MSKAAAITEIEHKIEALQTTDQLKLLERMVRHLKHTLIGRPPVKKRETTVSRDLATLRGALKQHASPELREQESAAFAQAMNCPVAEQQRNSVCGVDS